MLALATRVEFDTPFGFTVPTQLAFVPLVFAVPLAIVPLAVVAGAVDQPARRVLRGEMPPSRLLRAVPNAWFAIGPVAVFAIANIEPRHAGAGPADRGARCADRRRFLSPRGSTT